MKATTILIFTLFFCTTISSCQKPNSKDIAKINFEEYFKNFKEAYPADQFEYSFSNYSELFELRPFPSDMMYLSKLDSFVNLDKYYSLYAYKVKRVTKDAVQVNDLPINSELKLIYYELKKLVLSSENREDHDLKEEIELAAKIRELMKKEKPPLTGYGQTVHSHSENSEGITKENEIYIEYDLDLKVVNMSTIK